MSSSTASATHRSSATDRMFRRNCLEWRLNSDSQALLDNCESLLDRISRLPTDTGENVDVVDVSSCEDGVLIVSVTTIPQPGTICIRIAPIPEIDDQFRCSWVDQIQATRENYESFVRWIGQLVPGAQGCKRTLLLKIRNGQTWFLNFPATSFARLRMGEFAKYDHVHWILSDRTFEDVIERRRQLLRLLSDLPALLDGVVLLINKYQEQIEGPEGCGLSEGFGLIEELTLQYQNVIVEDKEFRLRSIISPSAAQITDTLCDPKTKIVFGAFEAATGEWQVSNWPKEEAAKHYVHVEELAGKLKHVSLLRIFHCNAVYGDSETNPRTSIVFRLLHSGAHLIEGGVTEESYFEFQEAVLRFFFNTPLYHTLEMRDLNGEFDLRDFTTRCNKFLLGNGFSAI